jgi:hypothetical protein
VSDYGHTSWDELRDQLDAEQREALSWWAYRRHVAIRALAQRVYAAKFRLLRALGAVIGGLQRLCSHDLNQIISVRMEDGSHQWVTVCQFCGDFEVADDEDTAMYDEAQRRVDEWETR